MVTGKDHRNGFFVRKVGQGVAPIVHSRQFEGYCLIARAQIGHVIFPFSIDDFTERVMTFEDFLPLSDPVDR
jgi:hypothetical protein